MDKKIGQKLNFIWDELRKLPEQVAKTTSDALVHVAKSLDGFSKAQTETKDVLDKLLVTAETDDKKRTIEGVVEVKALYDEMDKALKANAPKDVDYPELQKMFDALGIRVDGIVFDPKAIAEELVKVLPAQKELTIDKKIEVFGKTLTKIEGNTANTPLYVSVVNASEISSGGQTVLSQSAGVPEEVIDRTGALPALRVSGITISGATLVFPNVDNETPSGTKNGVNTTFTTFYNYKPNTTKVFLNGIRLREGVGFDYYENGTNVIVFSIAPLSGDTIIIDYVK